MGAEGGSGGKRRRRPRGGPLPRPKGKDAITVATVSLRQPTRPEGQALIVLTHLFSIIVPAVASRLR
jgi:hypothetical protein